MKKTVSLLTVLVMLLSLSIPAFAAESPNTAALTDDVLSDAYISFSEKLNDLGFSANTCFEDFVSGYKGNNNDSIQNYVDALVDIEIENAARTEAIVAENLQYALENADLQNDNVTPYSVTYAWYDNIGTSSPSLPREAKYSQYNILSAVKKGDILQETDGLIAQFTGHIAIIQGKYWDSTYKQYYIRTIEAGASGVVYGVLDDTRYDDRGVYIHYVTSATTTNISNAVTFCQNQLGKAYNWGALTGIGSCSSSSSASTWYCTELVWAAFYNQGINIYGSGIPGNIYMPSDFAASSKLTSRSIY